jgi:nonribosomal peptide synthetase DhbF
VEPGEIETVLSAQPEVAQASVILQEDSLGGSRLVGYLVRSREVPALDTAGLRARVSSLLPHYMVPAVLVELDTLPLTPNGKLDRGALPAPDFTARESGRAPGTPRETLLLGLFEEVLQRDGIGMDDDFFALGGDSLLATMLLNRIRRTGDRNLHVRDLFEAPTPASLAQRLSVGGDSDPFDVLLPLRPVGRRTPLFCIHPGFGVSWSYVGLAPHLPTDLPLYGLQARSLRETSSLPQSVEEMALDYLSRIRSVQPTGPYRLLGWSFGGAVAHAMATRLQADGEQVDLLVLLDAYPASVTTREGPPVGTPDVPLVLGGVSSAEADSAARSVGVALSELGGLRKEEIEAVGRTYFNSAHLAARFTPGLFRGDLLFFTAGLGRTDDAPTANSWREYVSDEILDLTVQCLHDEMTRPAHLAIIGRAIAARLEALATDEPDHG